MKHMIKYGLLVACLGVAGVATVAQAERFFETKVVLQHARAGDGLATFDVVKGPDGFAMIKSGIGSTGLVKGYYFVDVDHKSCEALGIAHDESTEVSSARAYYDGTKFALSNGGLNINTGIEWAEMRNGNYSIHIHLVTEQGGNKNMEVRACGMVAKKN